MRVRVLVLAVLSAVLLVVPAWPAVAAPANDNFANATTVPPSGMDVVAQTGAATREAGEPNHAGIANAVSVWYRWTPDVDAAGHIQFYWWDDPSAIAVYTGSSLGTLKLVGDSRSCQPHRSADDSGDRWGACVWFTAFANTTYRIAIVPKEDWVDTLNVEIGARACTVEGSSDVDLLDVTSSRDIVCGFGGDDIIYADGPVDDLDDEYAIDEDMILGGPGNDTINYSGAPAGVIVDVNVGVVRTPSLNSQREMFAEIGNVTGSSYSDRLDGNSSANTLSGGRGTDVLNGGAGADLLRGGNGVDNVAGNEGNDALYGGPSNDLLFPGAGDDVLWGESGTDGVSYKGAPSGITLDLATRAASGWGADVLNGIENAIGSAFADVLRGSTAQNMLSGGGGADTLRTNDGIAGDTANGGPGTDSCTTDSGDVRISCP